MIILEHHCNNTHPTVQGDDKSSHRLRYWGGGKPHRCCFAPRDAQLTSPPPGHQSTKPLDSQEPTIIPQDAQNIFSCQRTHCNGLKCLEWPCASAQCTSTKTGVPKSFTQTFNNASVCNLGKCQWTGGHHRIENITKQWVSFSTRVASFKPEQHQWVSSKKVKVLIRLKSNKSNVHLTFSSYSATEADMPYIRDFVITSKRNANTKRQLIEAQNR